MDDVVLSVADVGALLERLYPPAVAADWDAIGLIAGDPTAPVRRVLFAVDAVLAVVDEALTRGADLVITHHPLFLRGVHGVAANTYKGAIVHRLIAGGVALYNAHTNADSSPRGVAAALADLMGVEQQRPLVPAGNGTHDGSFYGVGRVGELPQPMTLRELAMTLANRIPATPQGVRVAGDLTGAVKRVAVVGGAGDSLFDAVRAAEADVYVTADLRHHPASELREAAMFSGSDKPYLLDVSHYASEWPWLPYAAADLAAASRAEIESRGGSGSIECLVSTQFTDPWDAVIQPMPLRQYPASS